MNPQQRHGWDRRIAIEPLEGRLLLDGAIGGLAWDDLDGDGVRGAGEVGLAGAAAELMDAGSDGQPGGGDDLSLGVRATGSDGSYTFDGLAAGHYYLRFRAPVGFAFSPQDAGGDDSADSDADATGQTAVIALAADEALTTVDAGLTGASPAFGWALAAGSEGGATGMSIAVGADGSRYVAGHFYGTVDFDAGPGTSLLTAAGQGSGDAFVVKLDAAGVPVWAGRLGGDGEDQANGVAVDAAGNVYVAGFFSGTADFDPSSAATERTSAGLTDIFLVKLDAAGGLVWAASMGGPASDEAKGVAVDEAGSVYATGSFAGTADFDPSVAVLGLTSAGESDAFVVKLDSAGGLAWARAIGGGGSDVGNAIAVDAAGNVLTTGQFRLVADFDPGPAQHMLVSAGSNDVFVSKLDASGAFAWATAMGGTLSDSGSSIATDAAGGVYAAGCFSSVADFDGGAGTCNLVAAGSRDAFVAKLDSSGALLWAASMGGAGDESAAGVALDAAGNVVTAGYFQGTADFDPGPGAMDLTSAGASDVFAVKLDSAGALVWARAMGGPNDDLANAVAVGAAGEVHTTGYFFGEADFDPGAGEVELSGDDSAFVASLDSAGGYVQAAAFAGSYADESRAVATDAEGNVYVAGSFRGREDFDPGPGAFVLASRGTDAFVAKYTPAGALLWARAVGGEADDRAYAIAVDTAGNVHVAGSFAGTADFDPAAATAELTSAGGSDAFVVKLDSGGLLVWAAGMGGPSTDEARGLAVDPTGNVYVTGRFWGTADFDPAGTTAELTSAGGSDAFVVKLDPAGGLAWAAGMGGTGTDEGLAVAADPIGNAHVTGYFTGTADFDPDTPAFWLVSAGSRDAFVAKLDAAGAFVWAGRLGGAGDDRGQAVAVDPAGNVLAAGFFNGTADFDPGPAAFELTSAGGSDAFVAQLDAAGAFAWAAGLGGPVGDAAYGIAADAAGNVYTTGLFRGTANFDPSGAGGFSLTAAGGSDVFLSKLDASGAFAWTRRLGGVGDDQAVAVAVDAAGWVCTTGGFDETGDFDPGPGTFDVAAGSRRIFVSRMVQATIGGLVWDDLNVDGAPGAGEDGIDGVTVRLYLLDDSDGSSEEGAALSVSASQVTAGGGLYVFAGLAPGRYRVDVDESSAALVGFVPSGGDDPAHVDLAGGLGVAGVDFGYRIPAAVEARYVFYNNSKFDGGDPAANELDDDAIAPDKTALRPGDEAGFANYTSYSRGINGIIVDISRLARPDELSADDFDLLVGNSEALSEWTAAPAPTVVNVRLGEGEGGSARVTLIWPDNAIQKQWLRVAVKANDRTGLTVADVFYFGNAIGESGDSETNTNVDSGDRLGARANPRGAFNPAPINFAYDFNRDGLVDSGDRLIARANATSTFTALQLIQAPIEVPSPPAAPSSMPSPAGLVSSTDVRGAAAVAAPRSTCPARPSPSPRLLFCQGPMLDSGRDLAPLDALGGAARARSAAWAAWSWPQGQPQPLCLGQDLLDILSRARALGAAPVGLS